MTRPIAPEHRVLLIRLTQQYRNGMSDDELYEATRRWWRVGPRRENVDHAFAVHGGVVQACYAIEAWEAASDAPAGTRPRWGFTGRRDPDMEARYVGADVSGHFKRGAQNPITYVNA